MSTILGPHDPPVITHRPGTIPGILAVAEHAGFAVPAALDNLGCDIDFSNVHFGCDIGVAGIMKELNGFGAETYEGNYSRAVLDPNRMLDSPTLIPRLQDGTILPANARITEAERAERIRLFYDGYHAPLDRLVEDRIRAAPDLFYLSVHSMEKRLEIDSLGNKTDGRIRPRIALLYRDKEEDLADEFASFFWLNGIEDIGMNIPYDPGDKDHKSPIFEKYQSRIPLLMIEFRNDLIRDEEGVKTHARLLWDAIEEIILKR